MRAFTLLVALYFAITATTLGLNCKGSSFCKRAGGNLDDIIAAVNQLPDSATFAPKQSLTCVKHLCAFTQKTGDTITKATALEKLGELKNNNCKICGSAPLKPGNDVNQGELTVNYVAKPNIPCSGKCEKLFPGQLTCPAPDCYNFNACYLACCQGPTPITNPLSCSSVAEQCSCAASCKCAV